MKLSMRWLRRVRYNRTLLLSTIAFVFLIHVIYAEFWCYISSARKWITLPKTNNELTIRLMLISDPQIVGYQNEPFFPFGFITRWDADRYMAKTFNLALKHIKPELIIFLGDLMDEGSIASDDHFQRYTKRFFKLFSANNVFQLFIPGDNDIGGEGGDAVTTEKRRRFKLAFMDNGPVTFKFAQFFRVNIYTQELDEMDVTENVTKIIVSHHPLLSGTDEFRKEAIKKIKPHLIFSGHDHSSVHYNAAKDGEFDSREFLPYNREWIFNLNDKIHELVVPTCSYRMGTRRIGYGAAIIESNNTVFYTVLQTPDRYWYLFFYLYIVLVVTFIFMMTLVKNCLIIIFCN